MNAKALVIGLGGIGSEIVNKLEKKTGKEKKTMSGMSSLIRM